MTETNELMKAQLEQSIRDISDLKTVMTHMQSDMKQLENRQTVLNDSVNQIGHKMEMSAAITKGEFELVRSQVREDNMKLEVRFTDSVREIKDMISPISLAITDPTRTLQNLRDVETFLVDRKQTRLTINQAIIRVVIGAFAVALFAGVVALLSKAVILPDVPQTIINNP